MFFIRQASARSVIFKLLVDFESKIWTTPLSAVDLKLYTRSVGVDQRLDGISVGLRLDVLTQMI